MSKYRALIGLDYGDTRVEAGDIVEDIPDKSIPWLLKDKLIEPVKERKPTASKKEGD